MATILRRDGASPTSYVLSDMDARADEYVARVRNEAAKLVRAAREEADSIRAEAEAAGLAAAEKQVAARVDAQTTKRLKTLGPAVDAVVKQLNESHDGWLAHWETAAVELAGAIAERIVRRELAADPAIPREWVREALGLAAGSSEITLLLNPTDHANAEGYLETLRATVGGAGHAETRPDPAVPPGGCVVRTQHGEIDQRLETQLRRLTDELL